MQRKLVAGRRRMALVVLLTRAAFQVFGPAAWADASAKPNVLIVMTDDQGLGDFSFTGNPLLKTPNFDAFAQHAIRLTDFHVAPMCSPTRGQLLTGLAALRNGATSVTAGRTFLRPGIPTLADVFSHAGYRTGIFGKWHLGDSYPHRPIDKGFQESVYHLGWGQLQSTPEFDWPLIGRLGEPRDLATPTQNTDLLPTLCDLCGVAPPARDPRDALYLGVSLASHLRASQPLPDRMFVVQYGQKLEKFDACVVSGKWRLVKGQELHDVEADRAQQSDVAAQHPDVVAAMRDHYERWWQGLEPTLNEFVPISIGAAQQPVVELTSGDWEGIYADNSGYVREAVGGPTGGHWNIQVEEAGSYAFTLRRWPERAQVALGEKYDESPSSPANKPDQKIIGFPMIAGARIEISGISVSATADQRSTSATVTAQLPPGRTKLKAWFVDGDGHGLCGAFFVAVAWKEGGTIATPQLRSQ